MDSIPLEGSMRSAYSTTMVAQERISISDMWGDGRIWQSNSAGAHHKEALSARKICRILDLSGGGDYALPHDCKRVAIALEDHCDTQLSCVLNECFDFIDGAIASDMCILVHCEHGRSRSSACIIAWLMKRQSMTLDSALNHCKQRRSAVRPNNGFFRQLRALDIQCNGRDSMPLNDVEYSGWCQQYPNGAPKSSALLSGCAIS